MKWLWPVLTSCATIFLQGQKTSVIIYDSHKDVLCQKQSVINPVLPDWSPISDGE